MQTLKVEMSHCNLLSCYVITRQRPFPVEKREEEGCSREKQVKKEEATLAPGGPSTGPTVRYEDLYFASDITPRPCHLTVIPVPLSVNTQHRRRRLW